MANLLISTDPLSDSATLLTVGNEIETMPASNLILTQPQDVWRTSDITNVFLEYDLGAAAAVNLVALLYNNSDVVTDWQVRGATSQANLTAAPGYNSGVVNMWTDVTMATIWDRYHAWLWLDPAQSYRYWRIDVTATGLSHFEAGRVYIDAAWQSPQNISFGWEMRNEDLSSALDNKETTYVNRRKTKRIFEFEINLGTETETWKEAWVRDFKSGSKNDTLVIIDPSSTTRHMDWTIYGLMQPSTIVADTYSSSHGGVAFSKAFSLVELETP